MPASLPAPHTIRRPVAGGRAHRGACTAAPGKRSGNGTMTARVPVTETTPPQDQLSVLKLVTARLEAARIPYMITGSIASGHYAQPRMTRDLDVVVELEPADASTMAAIFGDQFDCDPQSIRSAIERRALFNLIHVEAIVKVDVVVRKDTPYRIEEFGRRRRVDIDGQPMWMVYPEDLVLSKLLWARDSRSELQLRDVRQILTAREDLDWTHLDRWARALGIETLLGEVRT